MKYFDWKIYNFLGVPGQVDGSFLLFTFFQGKMNVTEWLKPLKVDFGEDEALDEDDLSEIQTMYF